MTLDLRWVQMQRQWLPDLDNYVFRNTNFNDTVFYHYAIPKVVDPACRRAIYLDSDVVVTDNVAALRQVVPDDAPIAAVRDYSIPRYGIRFRGNENTNGLPYRDHDPYFNSGVLAINVDCWREQHIHERARDTLSANPSLCRWPGQDPLNFALRGQWREVDLGWNLQTGGPDRMRRVGGSEVDFLGEPYEQIRRRAKIMHFTGNKPWDQGFTNPDRPAFVRALRESGWFSPAGFRAWQAKWWWRLGWRAARRQLAGRSLALRNG